MILLDVNVLVYAFREEVPDHTEIRSWLVELINGPAAYSAPDIVLSGFLRVVTHPTVFRPPTPLETALSFVEVIRTQPNFLPVQPGPRHWQIFEQLCRTARVKGNLVPDAYLAALAIETGSEWLTTDRDYARFPRLRWRHPLEA